MIVFPYKWKQQIPTQEYIYSILLEVLDDIPCYNLSLSGGIDSVLLLCALKEVGKDVTCYTTAMCEDHPDVFYSRLAAKFFGVKHVVFYSKDDKPVYKTFYDELIRYEVTSIIAGDGVDEYMGGYYDHTKYLSHAVYYHYLSRLIPDHLSILDNESGSVDVYLPYLDENLVGLMSRIPLHDKIATGSRKRIMNTIAQGKIPEDIINRNKYGFCDIWRIKC